MIKKILQMMFFMMKCDKHWVFHPIWCYHQAKHEVRMGHY